MAIFLAYSPPLWWQGYDFRPSKWLFGKAENPKLPPIWWQRRRGEGRHTENLRKDSVLIEPEGVIGMTTKEKVLVFMDCGISQAKIADMAQINRSTLSKWVSGQRDNINDETKEALEVALATMADRLNEAVYGETASPFQYDDIVLD